MTMPRLAARACSPGPQYHLGHVFAKLDITSRTPQEVRADGGAGRAAVHGAAA